MRLDRAVAPPGVIKNAAAYSLFTTDRGLYMIRTGRGWRIGFEPSGRLNRFFANKAVKRIQNNLAKAEASLNDSDLDAELERRRGSIFISWSSLTEVELRTDDLPEITFAVDGKNYRLQFERHRAPEVEALRADLTA